MSHHIIMPIRPAGNMEMNGSTTLTDKVARDCSKCYWTDKGQAEEEAKRLAEKYPQVQFAVFSPELIFEALPPPPPPPPPPVKLLRKRITETGEIVLDKEEA